MLFRFKLGTKKSRVLVLSGYNLCYSVTFLAVIAHNLSVFAHNHLIYIKRNTVFMQKLVIIHCRLPKSSYLCIVNQR